MSIKQQYITDGAGRQYSVSLDYWRESNPRGYYVCIAPCELSDGDGFYCVSVKIYDPESVRSCVKQVTRASKKAEAEAMQQFEAVKDIYFAPRGIAHVGTIVEAIAYADQRKKWTAGNV